MENGLGDLAENAMEAFLESRYFEDATSSAIPARLRLARISALSLQAITETGLQGSACGVREFHLSW
jgi:hypothetical protein